MKKSEKNTKIGYLIEYSLKEGFGECGERKKALCAQEKLAEMIRNRLSYVVWNAVLINIVDYKINHPEEILEELT